MKVTFHTRFQGPVTVDVDIEEHIPAIANIANVYHDCSPFEHLADAIEERANNCAVDVIETHYLKAYERKLDEICPKRPQEC